jgi:hypothetical protein
MGEFKIQAGKRYITRDGSQVTGVIEELPNGTNYKFTDPITNLSYLESGYYIVNTMQHRLDLVEEYIPSQIEIGKRYVKRNGEISGFIKFGTLTRVKTLLDPSTGYHYHDNGLLYGNPGYRKHPQDLIKEYMTKEQIKTKVDELIETVNKATEALAILRDKYPSFVSYKTDDNQLRPLNSLIQFHYTLVKNLPKPTTNLPESNFIVTIDNDIVKIGCQEFLFKNLFEALQKLCNQGKAIIEFTDSKLLSTRKGIQYYINERTYGITWEDADKLLIFLEDNKV